MCLDEALKLVKLAGYRVTKPKPKKQTRVGPTCVVMYADGVTCRMTTACNDEKLDWRRGFNLCQAAWQSRVQNMPVAFGSKLKRRYSASLIGSIRIDDTVARVVSRRFQNYQAPTTLPAIQRAWFERNGDVLAVWHPEAEAIAA